MKSDSLDEMLSYFSGKTIAILGYDDQGFEHAKKLTEYNVNVLVVLRECTSDERWKKAGFEVVSVWDAVDKADILQVW
ncbi:hypothetical protein [Bacillus sp. Marseille-P3661]|uniref:hypothetical protein n=1 Tax=Bacillus sp. Marseille-P3661 TaxID=1936234 RepID=UPI0021555AEF|nr:hypothetical protein [Bacillus sp. Marseille-P3661]